MGIILLLVGLVFMFVASVAWGWWAKSFKAIFPFFALGCVFLYWSGSLAADPGALRTIGLILSVILWGAAWTGKKMKDKKAGELQKNSG